MSSSLSPLTATQKYAAAALFALSLHQAQIHQSRPLGFPSHPDDDGDNGSACLSEERISSSSSCESVADYPQLWAHDSSGLLRPIFKYLEIDIRAWDGLQETVTYATASHHVGAFIRLLAEESSNVSRESSGKELALANAIKAMTLSLESSHGDYAAKQEKQREYEHACREKFKTSEKTAEPESEDNDLFTTRLEEKDATTAEEAHVQSVTESDRKPLEEITMLSYATKVRVLYELLTACLANAPEDEKATTRQRKGYDARHRVTLRLLSAWFDLKWITVESIETIVACSAMALLKEKETEDVSHPKSKWAKWKRGGIIGGAALAGGTLLAVTGGLAAPAIAAGFSALAPTLGTIIPFVGAGAAAFASAAGTVAGSVAVAASFGGAGLTGSKMARRIGDVDEFEFKAIGGNHNQGRLAVQILISGFVFEEDDFKRPWDGQCDNSESYVLQWESKHLIAVSTAIQDWLTSALAMEMMKHGAMMTVLSSLLVALAWPATLLYLTDIIDSKWTIALNRSDKAGKLLAEVLLKGLHGQRPVTLVGFSLGARVIFRCLQTLAESENSAGLVERVVLLGAPIGIKDMNWEATRKVVSGRYVNVYSTNDWMLGIAFRAKFSSNVAHCAFDSLLTQGLAGIQPVDVPGIENVDVTELIEGHSSYLWRTHHILEQLELDTYFPVFNRKIVES
ncbi:transmembrane and coiled-coil domain-containing protein 4-like isoform X3 [Salvia splendens]|uniref:transmembrane and coiled-coil domain-containing protein 4-like isoform X3 n=1 Tax=Salvia splendens TaxID=180675 RepID=UPI001C263954|nr:transmembrane and coiled-coil domain-containing protein 4-like isoform X3 [Salvia splendens]